MRAGRRGLSACSTTWPSFELGSGRLLGLALARRGPVGRSVARGRRRRIRRSSAVAVRRRALLGGWLRSRLARPVLVELHAPLALFVLLQLQLGAEGASRPAPESGHRLGGLTGGHQLLDHRDRQDLARLLLPDHEAAAGVVLGPARVPLPVLDHVAAADGTWSEIGPLDLHVLQPVELLDGLGRELRDVGHERRAAVLALLDQTQAPLPVAGELGRGERVRAEQPDDLDALLGRHKGAPFALDVADVDQPLDDRGARGRGADPRVLHRLAELGVVDVLARRLHRPEQRRLGEAPRWPLLLPERLRRGHLPALALLEPRQELVAARVLVAALLAL